MTGTCAVLITLLIAMTAIAECSRPTDWRVKDRAPPDRELPSLVVYLRQNEAGVAELERLLLDELSNPRSARYGQWLTNKQVLAYTAPPVAEQLRAKAWLESTGMRCQLLGDIAVLSGSVGQAERLFGVRFLLLTHADAPHDMEFVRCLDQPNIPAELHSVVHMVPSFGQLGHVPRWRPQQASRAATSPTDYGVVPQTLRQLYNVPESAAVTNANSSAAVVQFCNNNAGISFDDLTAFQQGTGCPADNITMIVGQWTPFWPQPFTWESTLDVQCLLGTARHLTVNGGSMGFWIVPGWIDDFIAVVQQRQQAGEFVPWVFSISYAGPEVASCQAAGGPVSCVANNQSAAVVDRTNVELMKLTSTGLTIVVSSGDAGAASNMNSFCDRTPSVNPMYSGSSPWVVSVGGTQVLDGSVLAGSSQSPVCSTRVCLDGNTGVEVVSSVQTGSLITSGGGFSLYADQPSYQAKAVSNWLASSALRPPAGMFNPANRGNADVSMIAHALQMFFNGSWTSADGTSASTPIFAGIVTLLNDIRFNANRPPLGFINPVLYDMWASQQAAYRDITVGNNTATEYPSNCTTPGYGAAPGWDPPTGLGTAQYQQMAAYVAALP